jgi:hypothetical protein
MPQPTPDLPPIGKVFNGANIPAELKALRRWAVWKAVWNESRQKYDKIPYNPQHYGLSTKKVSEWGDFETASRTLSLNPTRYAGLGLVLTDIKGVVGIDLDNCRHGGQIAPWAREIVDNMGSYTEVSPSGNGLRILALGEFHTDWNNHDVGIEVYSGHTPRFLTITGDTKLAKPMAPAQPVALQALFDGMRKSTLSAANVIPIEMPELVNELALPDVADMPIPEATRELLLHGPGDDVLDRSGALHAAGVQLYSAGYDDATVLSILAASQPVMDIALSHRRQDPDRALAYLWVEHCQKAKPKATTPTDVMAEFDDVSADPEVVASAKKAMAAAVIHENRFNVETTVEFIVRRKATWLIKGVLPRANFGVFYGASGSGKSFFVFNLAAAIARGVNWRGHKTTKARVLWIAAEGQEDMRKRVHGYCMAEGIDPSDLDMKFISDAPNLRELADVKALVKQIKKHGEFDLIVIDTLAQVMPGGNENSGEDMGLVMGHCKEITRLTGAMVTPVHHSGKDESRGARGWSGLRAACDFEFEVIRADEDRVATVTKMKGGADGAEYGFRLQTLVVGQDDDGDDETTCVVEFTDSSRASVAASNGPGGNNQKLILDKARGMIDLAGAGVTFNEIVSVVWPLYPRGDETKRDQRKTNVGRDLRALISSGFLAQNDAGVVSLPVKAGA